MQEVLISIRRPNTDRIFAGTKTVELRRTVPRDRPEWGRSIERSARKWEYKYSAEPAAYPMRVWMYESRAEGGAGGIVGFFLCFGWAGTKGDHLPEMAERAQVTMQQLRQYAGDGWVYGWNVDSPTKLAEPVPLGKIGLKHPPQSWRYLDTEAAKILQGVADHAAPAE